MKLRQECPETFPVISRFYSIAAKILLLSFLITATACTYGRVIFEGEAGSVEVEHGSRHYKSKLPEIPPGHMPPPGKCRIWYPDRPPGQQPPPGDCRELERHVPPGAWLIGGIKKSGQTAPLG